MFVLVPYKYNTSFIHNLKKTKNKKKSCNDPPVGHTAKMDSKQWPTGGSYSTECEEHILPQGLHNPLLGPLPPWDVIRTSQAVGTS